MRRREFIALFGGTVAWPLSPRAQQTNVPRIGFLGNSTAVLEANLIDAFRNGLREHGYEEGRNISIDYRWAEGNYERFPALIAELIALKVDLIVTAGTPAAQAVAKAGTPVPLVMVAVGDPIGTGLVASLARPGGNNTGLNSLAPELEGKRLDLLREMVPNLTYVAVLWNPANAYMSAAEREVQVAAKVLRMKVRTPQEIETALASVLQEQPNALNVMADRLFLHYRTRIMDFALQHRLPGVHAYRELVLSGGLMSYGPSYADLHRRAATYVDKILKGAKPGDLPVEQPAKFELVINMKTAKALGLAVPQIILAQADEVIE